MIAYDSGHMECVKMLMDKGAHVNIQNTVSLSGQCTCNAQHVCRVPSCE